MTTISNQMASGKSSAFFYLSPDQVYIFKTLAPSEVRVLTRILDDYVAHVQQNPHTILPRFAAVFQVELPTFREWPLSA